MIRLPLLTALAGAVLAVAGAPSAAQESPVQKKCYARLQGSGDALRAGMIECDRRQLRRLDGWLIRAYKIVMADPSRLGGINANPDRETLRKELRSAQRAWIRFRDAECRWAAAVHARGPEAELAEVSCLVRVTRARAARLGMLAKTVSEMGGKK